MSKNLVIVESPAKAKTLSQFLGKTSFAYVITVCDQAEKNCPYFPGAGVRLHWSFEDPAAFNGTPEAMLAKFREVRDQINAQLRGWIAEQGIQPVT